MPLPVKLLLLHRFGVSIGRRTNATFKKLLLLLEQSQLSVRKWITDAWRPSLRWAYLDCLDQNTRVIDKAQMQSIERKHLTLRSRIKRLARKTIAFSKSQFMHDAVIGLFINRFFFGLHF
ncbi:IS1 family transposase [Siphonobacter sp. SORGH_AS_1065]|uniref:IS1 family transposase n=1 Tax=Siphonobacter sp. SORGH_AS_1065 TaxID=3041795 RepID=UPI0027D79E67|nr:IS1 family transposase [Siphonobacter sp. SORGH_AS_1065]